MTRYLSIAEHQVPVGKSALLLFVHRSELCAGIVEHRCDGRLVRHLPEQPRSTELVRTIAKLMEGQALDGELLVIIDKGAFWPDAFPLLYSGKTNYPQIDL